MNKRERIIAAIEKKPVDHVPAGFSLHFPADQSKGEAGVRAHLEFFRETDTDIIKIMNENLVPYVGEIRGPEDFDKIPEITMESDFMKCQMDMTKRILAECDPEAFSIGTLHGIAASSVHPLEQGGVEYMEARNRVVRSLRENPKPVLAALGRITDGMCELAKSYIEAGLDGIYYAALGGEMSILTDEEHAAWMKPFDLKMMKAVRDAGGYCFLHICKDGLNMERFKDYMEYADVVNWGIYEAPMSLKDGKSLFAPRTIMGGLANRSGVLVDGTIGELKQAVKDVITDYGKTGFILGADCTLPTEIPYERIRAAVEAAREM